MSSKNSARLHVKYLCGQIFVQDYIQLINLVLTN